MTTRGIEDQYEELEDILDEINRVCNKVASAIENEDIHVAIAAMCTIIIDSVHQMDMGEEERAAIIRSAMAAAWKDYHTSPPTEMQH